GTGTQDKATGDTLSFQNNIIGGSVISAGYAAFDSAYLANPANSNTVYGGNANDEVKLKNPFQYLSARDNYVPQTGSIALGTGNFTYPKLNNPFFQTVTYRGAFG